LKDGLSDDASSDADDSLEDGLANEAPDPEVRPALDLGNDVPSKAYASEEVEDELDGRLAV